MARPPPEFSRRAALGVLSVPTCAAVGGCLESLRSGAPCSDPTHFSLQRVRHGAHVSNEFSATLAGLPYGTESVVSAAMVSGDATVRDYYAPALHNRYVVSGIEERYYRVETTDRDPATVTGYEYAVEIEDGSGGPQVRSFEALPDRDRESIRRALGDDRLLHAPHYDSFSVVFAYEDGSDRNRSRFVPAADDVRVEWNDSLLRFSFEARRSVTLTTTTVTAESVAESSEGFFEHVFEAHGAALADLPDGQRSIIDEAVADGVAECPPHSEPLAAVLDRLRTGDGEFVWLVGYDGTRYFTHVTVGDER